MVNFMKRIMFNNKKQVRPVDELPPGVDLSDFKKPPVAKYYRKENCCDSESASSNMKATVRTCGKVIPGSKKGCDAHTLTATTVLSPRYYSTNSQYLQARCRKFDQRSFNFDLQPDGTANANCCDATNVGGDCKKVIYKPTNAKYSVNGAVQSSTRLLRLKYDSIVSRKNGKACSSCSRYPPLDSKSADLKKTFPACSFKRKC